VILILLIMVFLFIAELPIFMSRLRQTIKAANRKTINLPFSCQVESVYLIITLLTSTPIALKAFNIGGTMFDTIIECGRRSFDDAPIPGIKANSSIETAPLRRICGDKVHLSFLHKSIKAAKSQLLISTYGINEKTLNKVIGERTLYDLLRDASNRGVKITIYNSRTSKKENYQKILRFFQDHHIKIIQDVPLHAKVLTVDDKVFCLGSYNWLCNYPEYGDAINSSLYFRGYAASFWCEHFRNLFLKSHEGVRESRHLKPQEKLKLYLDESFEAFTKVKYIDSINGHRVFVKKAFEKAKKRVIFCSPFWDKDAFEEDFQFELLNNTLNRGIHIYFIMLKEKADKLEKHLDEFMNRPNFHLILKDNIHCKTAIIDYRIISEGSFNWFQTAREKQQRRAKLETTLVYKGPRNTPEFMGYRYIDNFLEAMEIDLDFFENKITHDVVMSNKRKRDEEDSLPQIITPPKKYRTLEMQETCFENLIPPESITEGSRFSPPTELTLNIYQEDLVQTNSKMLPEQFRDLRIHGAHYTKLQLHPVKLDKVGAEIIASIIKLCPNLNELYLDCCDLNIDGATILSQVISASFGLRSIFFFYCDIEEEGFSALTNCIAIHQGLQKLRITAATQSTNNLTLANLNQAIARNKFLTDVTLQEVPYTDDNLSDLAAAIAEHPRLKRFSLEVKDAKIITTKGWGSLSGGVASSQSLQELDLSRNHAGNVMANFTKPGLGLKKLNLVCNSIGNSGAIQIAANLQENTTLEEMDLSVNRFDSRATPAFMNAFAQNAILRSLDCDVGYLWPDEVRKIGARAKDRPSLRTARLL